MWLAEILAGIWLESGWDPVEEICSAVVVAQRIARLLQSADVLSQCFHVLGLRRLLILGTTSIRAEITACGLRRLMAS